MKPGIISLEKLVEIMSTNPRRIFGIEGDPGKVTVDFSESFIVNPATFKSLGKATPYEGMQLYGKILKTEI